MIGTGLLLAIPTGRVDLDYPSWASNSPSRWSSGRCSVVAITPERTAKAASHPPFLSIGGLALVNAAIAGLLA
jgi:hypothetical protein